jgi:hypothetical protein
MYLKDKNTGISLESAISEVMKSDYKWIQKSSTFKFNWSVESENEVYKIYLLDNEEEILGLISLIDYPDEYRIHLSLIETSNEQRGKDKTIEHIAGCLLVFSCEIAFLRGYDGFLSLVPKTLLLDLYQNKYGFRQFGRLLAVEGKSSRALIGKYLADEES